LGLGAAAWFLEYAVMHIVGGSDQPAWTEERTVVQVFSARELPHEACGPT